MSEKQRVSGFLAGLAGADPRLLALCRRPEILHYYFRGAYLGLLTFLAGLSMAYLVVRLFDATTVIGSRLSWWDIAIATGIAIPVSLMCLNLYRIMLLSGPSSRHKELSFFARVKLIVPKLVIATIFGIWFGIPVCLFFIGNSPLGELTTVQLRQRESAQQEIESRYREKLEALYLRQVDLQKQIAKSKPFQDSGKVAVKPQGGPGARVDARTEMAQGELASLRAEISSRHAQLQQEKMQVMQSSASARGVIGVMERLFHSERLLCMVLIAIMIAFYAGPVLAQEIAHKGPYDFAVEYENIRCLATHRIVPNAHTVWIREAKYEIDRYLNPEELLADRLLEQRMIRNAVNRGLFSCWEDQRRQYEREQLASQE